MFCEPLAGGAGSRQGNYSLGHGDVLAGTVIKALKAVSNPKESTIIRSL
jgi:hypothetical protein